MVRSESFRFLDPRGQILAIRIPCLGLGWRRKGKGKGPFCALVGMHAHGDKPHAAFPQGGKVLEPR